MDGNDRPLLLVAGIDGSDFYFAEVDAPTGQSRYFRCPREGGGGPRLHKARADLAAALLAKKGLPEGFCEVPEPPGPRALRALSRSVSIASPARWQGKHVAAVAADFGPDGKSMAFLILERHTGRNIRWCHGTSQAVTYARAADGYIEEHEPLRGFLGALSPGQAPKTFPSPEVRAQFLALRKLQARA